VFQERKKKKAEPDRWRKRREDEAASCWLRGSGMMGHDFGGGLSVKTVSVATVCYFLRDRHQTGGMPQRPITRKGEGYVAKLKAHGNYGTKPHHARRGEGRDF